MKIKLSNDSGAAIVMTVIFFIGVLACLALAINVVILTNSSIQQYDNAAFAAEGALRAFVPSICQGGSSPDTVQGCMQKRMNASSFVGSASNSTDVSNAWASSLVAAVDAANAVSAQNAYVGKLNQTQGASIPNTSSNANSPFQLINPTSLVTGQLILGHCARRTGITSPPAFCTSAYSYCCYGIRPGGGSTGAYPTVLVTANAPYTQIWINAARVQLYSSNAASRGMQAFWKIFGGSDIELRKGNATVHFDALRMSSDRTRLYPFQVVDAVWSPSVESGLGIGYFSPTPTPTLYTPSTYP